MGFKDFGLGGDSLCMWNRGSMPYCHTRLFKSCREVAEWRGETPNQSHCKKFVADLLLPRLGGLVSEQHRAGVGSKQRVSSIRDDLHAAQVEAPRPQLDLSAQRRILFRVFMGLQRRV